MAVAAEGLWAVLRAEPLAVVVGVTAVMRAAPWEARASRQACYPA